MRSLSLLVTMAAVTAVVVVVAGLSLTSVSNPHDGLATQGVSASHTFYADDVGDSSIDTPLALSIFLCFLLPLRSRILRLSYEPQTLSINYEAGRERPG